MTGQKISPTSMRGPHPIWANFVIALMAVLLAAALYAIFSCTREWLRIVGLILDIGGAASLAFLDVPSNRRMFYADDLNALYEDLFSFKLPQLTPNEELTDILTASVQEYADEMPENPRYQFTDDDELEIMTQDGDSMEIIGLLTVQKRLKRQIDREEQRLRRFGLYMLIIGFGFQIVAAIFNDVALNGLLC